MVAVHPRYLATLAHALGTAAASQLRPCPHPCQRRPTWPWQRACCLPPAFLHWQPRLSRGLPAHAAAPGAPDASAATCLLRPGLWVRRHRRGRPCAPYPQTRATEKRGLLPVRDTSSTHRTHVADTSDASDQYVPTRSSVTAVSASQVRQRAAGTSKHRAWSARGTPHNMHLRCVFMTWMLKQKTRWRPTVARVSTASSAC